MNNIKMNNAKMKTNNNQIDNLKFLYKVVDKFNFQESVDRANFIGALITPYVRNLIDGPIPMVMIESNTHADGKSSLANLISSTYTKDDMSFMLLPRDELTVEKILNYCIDENMKVAVFDNVKQTINSAYLERVLTSNLISSRKLGNNTFQTIQNKTMFVMTANCPVLSDDLKRRTVRIILKKGYAWDNNEKYSKEDILEHIQCMVEDWYHAGKPDYAIGKMLTYRAFNDIITNILFHAGETHWMDGYTAQFGV